MGSGSPCNFAFSLLYRVLKGEGVTIRMKKKLSESERCNLLKEWALSIFRQRLTSSLKCINDAYGVSCLFKKSGAVQHFLIAKSVATLQKYTADRAHVSLQRCPGLHLEGEGYSIHTGQD